MSASCHSVLQPLFNSFPTYFTINKICLNNQALHWHKIFALMSELAKYMPAGTSCSHAALKFLFALRCSHSGSLHYSTVKFSSLNELD
jgi:hypothetical protein